MLRIFIIVRMPKYIKNYATFARVASDLLNYEYNAFLRNLIYFSVHKIFTNVSEQTTNPGNK